MSAAALTLESALYYHERMGFSVIPLRPRSKLPLGSWKSFQERPISRDELLSAYDRTPDANIGVIGGPVSGNLAVLDMDLYKARAADPRARRAIDRIKEIGAESWMVKTARGGLHTYVQTEEPISKSTAFGCIDIQAAGAYVVAPNSVFGSAGQYEFQNRPDKILQVSLSDLEFLGVQRMLELPPLHHKQHHPVNKEDFGPRPFGIPYGLWNKLTHGVAKGTRSETEYSIVLYLVQRGWSFDQVLTLFIQRAARASKFKELGHSGPSWLSHAFKTAQEFLKQSEDKVRRQIRSMEHWALTRTWAIKSHRDAYLAFLEIANAAGSFEIGASHMLLAERAGMNRRTIERILPGLVTSGLLERCPSKKRGEVSRFKVHGQNVPTQLTSHVIELRHFVQEFRGHDAFRHGALGSTGFAIFAQVCLQPGLQTESIKIGKSDKTRSRRLKQLEHYRILEHRLGWVVATKSQDEMGQRLYQAALDLDTVGAAERQRVYHKKQRILFKETLKRQAEEKEAQALCDAQGEVTA